MREILSELMESWDAGETTGMGTVVQTIRSAPRPPGASMLVANNGTVSGSVSGGCVEGAVYELCQQVINDGSRVLQRYGFSDDEAFAAGLTCGGIIDVFVEPVSRQSFPELGSIAADIANGNPVAVAKVIEHPDETWLGRRMIIRPDSVEGSLGLGQGDEAIALDARALLATGISSVLTYGAEGQCMEKGMQVFVSSFQAEPRMIIFGAIDFAAAMARQGKLLNYRVTVCDARPVFATKERFPDADEVAVSWPHRYLQKQVDEESIDSRTVLCVLTHDPKFDVPLLDVALRLEGDRQPAFIGAMGSRRTHAERLVRLRTVGLSDEQLSHLSSPIGMDLGGRTPEETAVSVAAEIIALRWGGSGARLCQTTHDIHSPEPVTHSGRTLASRNNRI